MRVCESPQAEFCGNAGLRFSRKPEPRPPLQGLPSSRTAQLHADLSPRENPHLPQLLEGERKQVTVLFADLKGSMELLADREPEEARQLLDPVLERMMAAMHRAAGNANPLPGDGAEGCRNPWGGSGLRKLSTALGVLAADPGPPSHCTEMIPGP